MSSVVSKPFIMFISFHLVLQTALNVQLLMWLEDRHCQFSLWEWGHQPHAPTTQSGGPGCLCV